MAISIRSRSSRRLWLLEIDLGRVLRYSTETSSVPHQAGLLSETLLFSEGLTDPSASLALSAGRAEASIGVEIFDLEEGAGIASLIARGVPLDGRWATLLRYETGSDYERAEVILRGRISSVSYGAPEEPVQLQITRSISEEAATLPPSQAVIDETTWVISLSPNYYVPDDSVGHYYPIIIGSPGYNASGSAYPAVLCKWAQYFGASSASDSWIPVGDGTIAATTVRLYVEGEENPTPLLVTPSTRTVSQVEDLLGRTLSVIAPDSPSTDTVRDVDLYVGYNTASGSGVKYRGAAIRGAGDVIRWVFDEMLDYPIDWSRTDAVTERLNAYKIDAAIVEPTNVWDWFQAEVLPLLPIEIRDSVRGLYPHLWRYGATANEAVAHLDATLGTGRLSRISAVATELGEIYNEITLEYGLSANADRYRFRRIATGEARSLRKGSSPDSDSRIRGSALLSESQRLHGVKQLTLQCGAIWDHATADLILRDKINAHAHTRRTVSYAGGQWLESLRIGDPVTLTDPEVYLEDEVALVLDLKPVGDEVQVVLLLLDNPRNRRRLVI